MLQDNDVPVDIKFSGLHIAFICLKFYILKEMLMCKCCVICYTFIFLALRFGFYFVSKLQYLSSCLSFDSPLTIIQNNSFSLSNLSSVLFSWFSCSHSTLHAKVPKF